MRQLVTNTSKKGRRTQISKFFNTEHWTSYSRQICFSTLARPPAESSAQLIISVWQANDNASSSSPIAPRVHKLAREPHLFKPWPSQLHDLVDKNKDENILFKETQTQSDNERGHIISGLDG